MDQTNEQLILKAIETVKDIENIIKVVRYHYKNETELKPEFLPKQAIKNIYDYLGNIGYKIDYLFIHKINNVT